MEKASFHDFLKKSLNVCFVTQNIENPKNLDIDLTLAALMVEIYIFHQKITFFFLDSIVEKP